jgi:hypothetical protein
LKLFDPHSSYDTSFSSLLPSHCHGNLSSTTCDPATAFKAARPTSVDIQRRLEYITHSQWSFGTTCNPEEVFHYDSVHCLSWLGKAPVHGSRREYVGTNTHPISALKMEEESTSVTQAELSAYAHCSQPKKRINISGESQWSPKIHKNQTRFCEQWTENLHI